MKKFIKVSSCSVMVLFICLPLFTSDIVLKKMEQLFMVSAWVTKAELAAGQTITADLLTEAYIKPKKIYGSIQSHDKLIGQTLTVYKPAGSTIYLNEDVMFETITR